MDKNGGNQGQSRRSFLLSSGGLLTGAWLAAQWPAIQAAAHEAEAAAASAAPSALRFLSPADAADVEAIAIQIVPSGATPGAHEAHAVYFVDRALSTFFAAWSDDFRRGLEEFHTAFRAARGPGTFAALPAAEQLAYLKTVDQTAFFETVRTLTLLGMFSSPKYGGNFEASGWKMMGFEDRHAFSPPFGYYDRDYGGFEIAAPKST